MFFFVSCGQSQISGSDGGGNHVEVIEFHYEYDHENGVFSFSNQEIEAQLGKSIITFIPRL